MVDADRDEVVLVPEGKEAKPLRIAVGRWPQQLVVDATGRAYVACRQAGNVDVIAPDFTVRSLAVGAEPRSLALDPAASRLYVGLTTAQAIAVVDLERLQLVRTVRLEVEPTTIALTSTELAVLPRRADQVTFVSTQTWATREVALSEDKRRAWHGLALVVAGDALVVIHAG